MRSQTRLLIRSMAKATIGRLCLSDPFNMFA